MVSRLSMVLAVAACALITACGGSEEVSTIDACAEVEDQTFYSLEEYECGQTPNGTAMCQWTLNFVGGTFEWSFSDIVSTGSYSCEGATLTAQSSGTEYFGFMDEDGVLTFNEIDYQIQ